MRTFLIALMIALLPVRGFVGDAMAMGMAMQAVQQNSQTAGEAVADVGWATVAGQVDTVAVGHGACPDHASASAGAGHAGHGGVCNACDVCHQATLAAIAQLPLVQVCSGFAPFAAKLAFTSADTAGSFKPPIL